MATVSLKGNNHKRLGDIKVGEIVVLVSDGSPGVRRSRIFTKVIVPGKLRVCSSPGTMIIELTELDSQYNDQLTGEFSQLAVRPLHEGEVVEIKN